MLTALPAAAQDATWRTAPGSGDFDTAGNWSPTGVPTRTAFFGASSVTSLSFSADTAIGGFTFNAGASDYVFTNAQFVRFNGAGIAINGGSARIVNNGALDFNGTSTAGSAAIGNTALMAFNDSSTAGNAAITNSGLLSFNGASTAANAMIGNDAIGALSFNNASTAGSATITNRGTIAFFDTSTAGTATIVNRGGGAVGFGNNSTAGNATITNIGGGSFLLFFDTSTAGNATIVNSATVTFGNASTAGNATIVNNSGGTLNFVNRSAGGTATIVNNGILNFFESSGGGNARIVNNAGGVFDMSGLVPTGMTAGSIEGGGNFFLGAKQLTVGSNGLSTTVSGVVSDGGLLGGAGGSLVKVGPGTLTLAGNSTYSGPTIVNGGALVVSGSLIGSSITLNGATALAVNGSVANGVTMNGAGTMAVNGNVGGSVAVNGAGALAVNGNVGGNVTMAAGSLLTGGGSIGGNLLLNGATIAPGNSIGTLSIGGNFAQNGGTYQLDANNAGQSDRINVGGAATINGGTVAVAAQPGLYLPKTTYTIVRANGGLSGAYSNVTSNFAFLVPSLSYDANDVYLTLTLSSFAAGAQTPNQYAVGAALDQSVATASGDFATVLGTLAGLSTQQGAAVLNMISGQQYAGFSNAMVQGGQLFLSSFANRAGSAAAKRVALAGACDATTPALWGAWGGAVGGTGSVGGNSNSGTFTYSTGGFVGGLDRKIAPNFLAGVTVGYQTGGQWTGGFDGRSITDTVQAGLYADFSQGPIYVDAVAAYAYWANQMWRPINIPGLQPRTAYGQTGANQFLGQLEAGYRVDLGGAPQAFVTPFALLQGSVATQNAFTETGAQSLNLNVAAQSTSSLRTVFGGQLGGAMDLGLRDKLAALFRLGWSHEYADIGRPVSASFVGAPAVPYTVWGASPQRDGVVVGLSAATALADAMDVYLRYEGTITGQDSSHALIAGLRVTW